MAMNIRLSCYREHPGGMTSAASLPSTQQVLCLIENREGTNALAPKTTALSTPTSGLTLRPSDLSIDADWILIAANLQADLQPL